MNRPYYNMFVIESFSAQKSQVDISETIPKNYYLNKNTNTFVYKQEQTIDLKADYLKSATLDNKSLTIPSTNVPIDDGQHTLVLILKDKYKQSAILYGGNENTGEITYNFWVKASIDPENEFNYSTKPDDTDLLTGLISNKGNWKFCW